MTGSPSSAVAVIGATGHTGKFVAAELERRGLESILIGRDAIRLAGLAAHHAGARARVARVEEPRSLDAALADAAIVINCAGPFVDTAFPVADAALRAGIPYLDVAAEQAVVRAMYLERDGPAREAQIPLVPAMAFYGGLADLLATAAAGDWPVLDQVAVAVALDSWHPTAGTRATGERNTAARLTVSEGRLVPLSTSAGRREWTFPAPFGLQEVAPVPLSEIVTINRHLKASAIDSYMNLAPLEDLHDSSTPPPEPADESGRSSQIFMMDVLVRRAGQTRRATARGRDIYAFTAPLVIEAAVRLLSLPRGCLGGAYAPGQVFDASEFLGALAIHDDAFSVEKTMA